MCDVGNWIFSKNLDELFGNFFGNFFGGFFWRIFLEEFFRTIFWRIFFRKDFFGRIFWRNSLFTLELTCLSRIWFLSRFFLNGEGRTRHFDPQKCLKSAGDVRSFKSKGNVSIISPILSVPNNVQPNFIVNDHDLPIRHCLQHVKHQ